MLSPKPYIFFSIILLFIIYLYFNIHYIDFFHKYISFILLICGIIGIFLYPISNKIFNEGESFNTIKKYLVRKYKKKSNT